MIRFAMYSLSFLLLVSCSSAAAVQDTNLWSRSAVPPPQCSPITPPPQKVQCGISGSLSQPNFANDANLVSDLQSCQNLCGRHTTPKAHTFLADPTSSGCVTFSFNKTSGICNLYDESLKLQGFVADTSSSAVFYSTHCFDCPSPCPQPFGTQLLGNPGFEASSSLLGPWNSGGNAVVTSPGHKSSNAYLCSKQDNCDLFQTVQACPGHVYLLSLDYKITAQKPVQSTFRIVASSMSYLTFIFTASWTTLELWFTTDSHRLNELVINFFPNTATSASDFLVDNVHLTRVNPAFQTKPGSAEFIGNGGFETGELAPWKAHTFGRNKAKIVSPGINSTHAFEFTGTVTDRDGSNTLTQTLSLKKGTRYLLQYTAQKVAGQAAFPDLFIGAILYEAQVGPQQNPTLDFKLPFQAQSDTVSLQMTFDFGPLLIDNVSVQELA